MNTRPVPWRLSRRAALKGAGVSLALPWLEAMTPLHRKARAASPKRFVFFFSPCGYIQSEWKPTGTETDFTLRRCLAPLGKYQSDIVILSGVDNQVANSSDRPGDDHMKGMGTMLTGIEVLPGKMKGGGIAPPGGLAGGISVDQELVQRLRPPTKFPSLEVGVQSGAAGTVIGYSSYAGPSMPLPPDNSPQSLFGRLFNDFAGGDDAALQRLRADRKSVLDAVLESYRQLGPRLGTADRRKLDAHLTTVQELEDRVLRTAATVPTQGCMTPAAPTVSTMGNANFPLVGRAQTDLLVMALACDLTRVASLQWANAEVGTRFSWLGATRGHHDMSHDPDTNAATLELLIKINTWYAEQFAYLVGRLKEIPDGDGTLLDNTLVLWANELSKANEHSHLDMPYVLAGRAGGAVKTGRFLQYGAVPHNQLLVSILNAFDIPAMKFGNPAYGTGPLAGLV